MMPRPIAIRAASIVVIASMVALLVLRAESSQTLEVPQASLDFGNRLAGTHFKWVVPFQNTGGDEIIVNEVMASCKCSEISPRSFSIGPGESKDVTFNISIPFQTAKTAGSTSDYEIPILVTVKSARTVSRSWTLTGRVLHPLELDVSELTFDGRSKTMMPYKCSSAVVSIEAKSELSFLSLETKQTNEYSGQIAVAIDATDKVIGEVFDGDLSLSVVTDDGSFDVTVPVVGVISGRFEVVPRSADFGPVRRGRELTTTTVVRSKSGKAFSLAAQADSLTPSFRVHVDDFDESLGGCMVTFSSKAHKSGTTTLYFNVNSEDATETLAFPITYLCL